MDTVNSFNFGPYNPRFTINQTLALTQAFAIHTYPNISFVKQLAKETLLSVKQVRKWFVVQRSKLKTKQKELALSTGEFE